MNLNWIKNIILILSSVTVVIVFFEIILDFLGYKSFSDFPQRYQIDKQDSYVIGYFKNDKHLPQSLQNNFNHIVEDKAYYPIPFHVELDKEGYRNKKVKTDYDYLFVGDSVTFGYGVDNNQTFSRLFSKISNKSVYNLSIPNAGPASYMYMIDSFLQKHNTKNIVVFLYLGNDLDNLSNSYWIDMFNGQAPTINTKIYRSDITEYNSNITVSVIKNRILYNSKIFYLLWNVYIKDKKEIFLNEINSIANIKPKKYQKKCIDDIEFNKKLINIVNELNKKSGLTININNLLSKDKTVTYNNVNKLVIELINKNILPITYDKKSLVKKLSSLNYKFYTCHNENVISKKLIFKKNIPFQKKKYIFYQYLINLTKKKYNVSLILLAAEYTLYDKSNFRQSVVIEKDLINKPIKIINTIPIFDKYYNDINSTSLYLDGSHLNVHGHKFLTNIIKNKVNSNYERR